MSEEKKVPEFLTNLADSVGGKITEVGGPLPDGSGFAIMSMPLKKDHWIYKKADDGFNVPPMPFRMGGEHHAVLSITPCLGFPYDRHLSMTKKEFADKVREAGRYAVKCATMDGKEMDFDPDALIQNLIVGMLGYHTDTGLSDDEWANPKQEMK